MLFKSISFILLSLTLISCGGGGGGSSSPSKSETPPKPNSKPTLSGNFSNTVNAGEESILLLSATDADGDALSVKLINKPDWITHELTTTQLKIVANPSLFDIENYTFSINLSDASSSNTYELSLSVVDSQSNWQTIQLPNNEIYGTWKDVDENYSIQFLDNGKGVIAENDVLTPFNWTNSDVLTLEVFPVSCFESCEQQDTITLRIIATDEQLVRTHSENNSNNKELRTLIKYTEINIEALNFVSMPYNYFASVFTLDMEALKAEIPVYIRLNPMWLDTTIIGDISQTADGLSIENIPTINNTENSEIFFINQINDELTRIEFQLQIDNIEILPLYSGFYSAKVSYRAIILTDLRDYQYSDFLMQTDNTSLEDFIQPTYDVSYFKSLIPRSPPEVELEATYHAAPMIYNNETLLSSIDTLFGGMSYRFTDANAGEIISRNFKDGSTTTSPFTWLNSEDQITLQIEDREEPLSFVTLPKDRLGVIHKRAKPQKSFETVLYTFDLDENKSFSKEDYVGEFRSLHTDRGFIYRDSTLRLAIDSNDRASTYYGQMDGYSKFESDNSISIIGGYCGETENFDVCYRMQMETYSSAVIYNFKLYDIKDDEYSFLRTFYYDKGEEEPTIYKSRRVFRKLKD